MADKEIGEKLFKELGAANADLKNPAKRAVYEAELAKNPNGVEGVFAELGKINWKDAYEKAARQTRLRLTGTAKTYTGARKWLSELSNAQHALLIFGTITAVGLGVYAGAKMLEKHRHQKRKTEYGKIDSAVLHSEKLHIRRTADNQQKHGATAAI